MADKEDPLEYAAERAARHPHLMAAVFAEYCVLENATDEDIREILQCDEDRYTRLRLCKRPRSRADIENIASFVGVNPDSLAYIIDAVKS